MSKISHAFDLNGKVALVTGGSKGLGKAMVMGLGAAGASVAINYAHDDSAARATFTEFQSAGYKGALVKGDVTTEPEVRRIVDEIQARLGSPDVVIINATCEQPQRPIMDYDWEFYQRMIDFFIKSPFLLTRACLPQMKAKHWGRIINIGSEVFQRGVPNFTAYVAAKGGQNGFTRGLATELAPFGITVNMISPGWIPVERHENDPKEAKDAYFNLIPAGRWGIPDDVAGAAVFLASDAASFVTGQNLCVNGGMTVA